MKMSLAGMEMLLQEIVTAMENMAASSIIQVRWL